MRIIVVTDPECLPMEAEALVGLLDEGAWRVHVRKPGADEERTARLLEEIPVRCRSRISLHDCHGLALRYGLGGVHLNGRNPQPLPGFSGLVSRSCHSFGELREYSSACDYLFLSPVFDSISKQGYRSHFSMEEICRNSTDGSSGIDWTRVFALGGVCPDNISMLVNAGFGGCAVLGYLWEPFRHDADVHALLARFRNLLRQ